MLSVIILNVVKLNVVAPLKPQTVLKTMSSCVFKAIERKFIQAIVDNYFDTITYFLLIIIWMSEFSKNVYALKRPLFICPWKKSLRMLAAKS